MKSFGCSLCFLTKPKVNYSYSSFPGSFSPGTRVSTGQGPSRSSSLVSADSFRSRRLCFGLGRIRRALGIHGVNDRSTRTRDEDKGEAPEIVKETKGRSHFRRS